MIKHPHIRLSSVIMGLSSALDLVSSQLVHHHRQTTCIAGRIADSMGLSAEEKSHLGIAAALHDIGAIALNLEFELFQDGGQLNRHAEIGYLLLKKFPPFSEAARIIRYHHRLWNHGEGAYHEGEPVPLSSHILHLADRVAVQIDGSACILSQCHRITEDLGDDSGRWFPPEVVEAFREQASREAFWLDAIYADTTQFAIDSPTVPWNVELGLPTLQQLSELFRVIIDFRSPLTASHSRSVASIAEAIARLVGFSGQSCSLMHIAGNLHDIGKLAIPVSILEKPGPLTSEEIFRIRSHPYLTYRVLSKIGELDEVCAWAALHHESLDGSGYPFRMHDVNIPLGSRIVAISDVFAALTENRSYREGMNRENVLKIMHSMAKERKLDAFVFDLVESHFDALNELRAVAASTGNREFRQLRDELSLLNPEKVPEVQLATEPQQIYRQEHCS